MDKDKRETLKTMGMAGACVTLGAVAGNSLTSRSTEEEIIPAEVTLNPLEHPIWYGDAITPNHHINLAPNPNSYNVVILIVDTLRADHLGCYGNIRGLTPNMDRLARDGVVFEHAYAQALPTIPARKTYLTGADYKKSAKIENWTPLEPREVSIAEILEAHDFRTQLLTDTRPYWTYCSGSAWNLHLHFAYEFIRGQVDDRYKTADINLDTRDLLPGYLWDERFDKRIRQHFMNIVDSNGEFTKGDFSRQICDRAIEYVDNNKSPFCLYLDFFGPHEPWMGDVHRMPFLEKLIDEIPSSWGSMPTLDYGAKTIRQQAQVKEEDLRVIQALYAAEVAYFDQCLGSFLRRMEQMDDTLVILTSDHGTHLGEGGHIHKSPELLNAAVTRLPLIMKFPGNKYAGKRVDGLVGAMDIVPTILDVLNIKHQNHIDGTSVLSLITGKQNKIHDEICTFFGTRQRGRKTVGIRDSNHSFYQQLFEGLENYEAGLFDYRQDPRELINLLDKVHRTRESVKIARRLRERIEENIGSSLASDDI